jgi:hypothetical protein
VNADWKYVADEAVFDFVTDPRLSRASRRRLKEAFYRIVSDPMRPAQLMGHDKNGQPLRVLIEGEIEVVYWVDHLAREVRITAVFRDWPANAPGYFAAGELSFFSASLAGA